MFNWKQKLMAVAVGCFLAAGVGAQKRDGKRPPKDENRVIVQPKDQKPPPQNNNNRGDRGKGDKKGKP